MSPTEIQTWAAVAQAILAGVLMLITGGSVLFAARSVGEQREGRLAAFLPLFQWQTARADASWRLKSEGGLLIPMHLDLLVYVVMWNIGPGAARITQVGAVTNLGETFDSSLKAPSSIPAREQGDILFAKQYKIDEFVPALRRLTVKVVYSDIMEGRRYSTTIVVDAHFETVVPYPPQTQAVLTSLIDSDERSARQRRIDNPRPDYRLLIGTVIIVLVGIAILAITGYLLGILR